MAPDLASRAAPPLRPAATLTVLVSALLPLLGCAESTYYAPSKPIVVFPTRVEIAQIPAKAPLPQLFGTTNVAVDEWSVDSAPLPSSAPYDDSSPWGALLRDLVKMREASVTLSPAMRCAAAEVARFHLKQRALPVESLRRFIVARCGGETPSFAPLVLPVDAPAGVSDEAIIAMVRDTLANAIEEPLARGHFVIGLAAVRDATHASVVVAIGADEARFEAGTHRVDAGRHVTLRGRARDEYAQVTALVNRGDFGVSRCIGEPGVHAPYFVLTCELAPGDPFDWVEVLGVKQGRVMLHPLADILVYEGDASAVRYKAKSSGAPTPVDTPAAFTASVVNRINAIRTSAKMPSLVLSSKQSAENERLAGTILDATLTPDDDSAEKATLGLIAGWDVDGGMIRGGQFFLSALAPTHDASAWVDASLERPIGRLTFLEPEARVIAVGPSLLQEGAGLAAAVTTYMLFESDDHQADEARFFARIKAARDARAFPPPARLPVSKDMRAHVASVHAGEETPLGALNEMIATASYEAGGAPAYGYVLETNDLASVAIPEILLKAEPFPMSLAITHHRAPGAAWGQYVIFALLPGLQPPAGAETMRKLWSTAPITPWPAR